MRVFLESGKDVMDPKAVKDVCKDKACVEYLVKMLESEDHALSKAAMITTRTALAPEVGYHQMLIDCGIIKTLTDIMNQKLLLRKPSRMKKEEQKTRIVHQVRTRGRAAHLIGLLAYNNEKMSDALVCSSAQRENFTLSLVHLVTDSYYLHNS